MVEILAQAVPFGAPRLFKDPKVSVLGFRV